MKVNFKNIVLILIILYSTTEASEMNSMVGTTSTKENHSTLSNFQSHKMIKKELKTGDASYSYKEHQIAVISHGCCVSDTDRAYVDYIFYRRNQEKSNIRFYDIDNFVDLGDVFLFNGLKNDTYALIEHYGEGEDLYFFVVEISNNKAVKKIFEHGYGDTHFDSQRYTPQKLLKQDKYLPITYTMFEKDGGLYIKVGSTYKSDIITLKKPTSVK